jgi:hypothetical protein
LILNLIDPAVPLGPVGGKVRDDLDPRRLAAEGLHGQAQASLQELLGERGHEDLEVAMAMRYGSPSLPQVLDEAEGRGVDRIVVLPAYPQYSGTTTASIWDAVFAHYAQVRNIPELRLVRTTTTTKAISRRCRSRCSNTGRTTAAARSW